MAADGGALDAAGAARAQAFAAFGRRLDPNSPAPLVVGLSGGGDSLALLVFALEWARAAGRRVLALSVDHGLDPDSARWTAQAGATAQALGADWRPLSWRGPKPSTGLPAAARRARHALLADAARAAGAPVVLLGHTADDVAESDLIRRETPSHGRLRDWAPSPVWPEGRGVFLLRPLLEVRRRALREVLTERGLAWLEDPANADVRFARTRARVKLQLGPAPSSFLSEFPGGEARPWLQAAMAIGLSGVISLDLAALRPELLTRAVACAGGDEAPPSGAAVARLLTRLASGETGTATLGGARVAFAEGGATLCRELGRRPPTPLPLASGEPQVFDGRFELVADAPGWRVAPLAGHARRLPREDRRRLADTPAVARPALPVLLHDGGAVRLPRPFGDGPAGAHELVSARLAAAFGRIDDERDLARNLRVSAVHGA